MAAVLYSFKSENIAFIQFVSLTCGLVRGSLANLGKFSLQMSLSQRINVITASFYMDLITITVTFLKRTVA